MRSRRTERAGDLVPKAGWGSPRKECRVCHKSYLPSSARMAQDRWQTCSTVCMVREMNEQKLQEAAREVMRKMEDDFRRKSKQEVVGEELLRALRKAREEKEQEATADLMVDLLMDTE